MIRGKISYCLASIAIVSLLVISGCVSETPKGTPAPTAVPTGISVEILNAPAAASAGQGFDVVWRVSSPAAKTIPHTAVHYGPQSQTEPLTLTSYPVLTTAQNGTIPANFSARILINTTGTTYFRAHAIIDGVHYWSQERTIMINSPSANISGSNTTTLTASTATPKSTVSGY